MTAPTVATPETRRRALEMAEEYAAIRRAIATSTARADALRDALKAYLGEHGERELIDEETGHGVMLQERRTGVVYDLVTMRTDDRPLFERLANLGCLGVNKKALDAQVAAGQIAGVDRYASPGGVTAALLIVGEEP